MFIERLKLSENKDQSEVSGEDNALFLAKQGTFLEQHSGVAVRKLKNAPDTDPSFFDQTGGILMIFCFAILFGLSCVVVRMIYRRINWSKLMGNNVNKHPTWGSGEGGGVGRMGFVWCLGPVWVVSAFGAS